MRQVDDISLSRINLYSHHDHTNTDSHHKLELGTQIIGNNSTHQEISFKNNQYVGPIHHKNQYNHFQRTQYIDKELENITLRQQTLTDKGNEEDVNNYVLRIPGGPYQDQNNDDEEKKSPQSKSSNSNDRSQPDKLLSSPSQREQFKFQLSYNQMKNKHQSENLIDRFQYQTDIDNIAHRMETQRDEKVINKMSPRQKHSLQTSSVGQYSECEIRDQTIHKNGFQRPFHCQQVISWFDYLMNLVLISLAIIEITDNNVQLGVGLTLNIGILIIVFIIGAQCTGIDPTDPNVYFERNQRDQGTKHCGDCNRCVAVFDHHCKWLNNCIGELNYNYFLALISTYLIYHVFAIAILISLFAKWNDVQNNRSPGWLALACFLFLMTIIKIIAIGQLLFWHMWFIKYGITTYEYILEQREILDLKSKLKDGMMSLEKYKRKLSKIVQSRKDHREFRIKSRIIIKAQKQQQVKSQQSARHSSEGNNHNSFFLSNYNNNQILNNTNYQGNANNNSTLNNQPDKIVTERASGDLLGQSSRRSNQQQQQQQYNQEIGILQINESESNDGKESIIALAEKIKSQEFTDDEKVNMYNESGPSSKEHLNQRTGLAEQNERSAADFHNHINIDSTKNLIHFQKSGVSTSLNSAVRWKGSNVEAANSTQLSSSIKKLQSKRNNAVVPIHGTLNDSTAIGDSRTGIKRLNTVVDQKKYLKMVRGLENKNHSVIESQKQNADIQQIKSLNEYENSEKLDSKEFKMPSSRQQLVKDYESNRMFNSKSPIYMQKASENSMSQSQKQRSFSVIDHKYEQTENNEEDQYQISNKKIKKQASKYLDNSNSRNSNNQFQNKSMTNNNSQKRNKSIYNHNQKISESLKKRMFNNQTHGDFMNLYGERNNQVDKAATFDMRPLDIDELYSMDLNASHKKSILDKSQIDQQSPIKEYQVSSNPTQNVGSSAKLGQKRDSRQAPGVFSFKEAKNIRYVQSSLE
ncbi:uncharacterized protein containing dhhc-type zn finger [Stylonychia lemnae]|uniref:Uncharacterized protein containing dhhc-type zn finger n=1 Tax=Stylonychia lemnae TaxID=5949 RepID=A0A078AVE7_STYLE|nr:uncharacterized protein containing dhhc-type zn finger [Stylonychia lemnae]|eukprot:CDW84803.1 uncharacterized protein containing dhhc-type zn finger [Stylonychia lemnae]